jgi:hypothetical protein
VTIEGHLASPQDVDGDYFRARSRQAQPARNFVSARADPEQGYYEYQEVLRDPASPIAAERLVSRAALKRDQAFADAWLQAFAEATQGKTAPPRSVDLRRLFREVVAEPYARAVATIAERPLFGPRERSELDRIHDALEQSQQQLAARISALTTGIARQQLDDATQAAIDKVGESLLEPLERAGIPYLGTSDAYLKLSIRATLVMPLPILKANACFSGDTVVWEFGEDDLFGRGFEMKALATER